MALAFEQPAISGWKYFSVCLSEFGATGPYLALWLQAQIQRFPTASRAPVASLSGNELFVVVTQFARRRHVPVESLPGYPEFGAEVAGFGAGLAIDVVGQVLPGVGDDFRRGAAG